jgi:hypothetical protein
MFGRNASWLAIRGQIREYVTLKPTLVTTNDDSIAAQFMRARNMTRLNRIVNDLMELTTSNVRQSLRDKK